MATVGDIVVNLSANTRKFQGDLNRGSSLIAGFAKSAVASAAGAAAAFFTLRSAINLITEETEKQLKAERKLNAVLVATGGAAGKTADEIYRFASARQAVTNFGDDMTVNAAAVLATFKEIRGEAFNRTLVAAQDLASVLDGDLQGAIIQVGKALNSPKIGLTALRRVGVSFTDSQVEMIKRLEEAGDLMGAQNIILQELETEFGGASEALVSPWQQMKNAVGDLADTIGKKLKPVADSLWDSMRSGIQSVTAALDDLKGNENQPGAFQELFAFFENTSPAILQARREAEARRKAGGQKGGKGFASPIPLDDDTLDNSNEFNKSLERSFQLMDRLRTPAEKLFDEFHEAENLFAQGLLPEEFLQRAGTDLIEGLAALKPGMDDARRSALRLVQETKTPMEKYQEELSSLQELFATQQDVVTPEVFGRGIAQARQRFLDSFAKDEPPPGVSGLSASARSSGEAFSAIQTAIRSGNNQPINRIEKHTELANKLAQDANNLLQQVVATQEGLQVVGL